MKDDAATNILFIQMVESLPALYNHNLKEYSSKKHQNKIWGEIAEKFNGTVNECKLRWQYFRSCYTRHLKEINNLKPGAKLKKPHYLLEHLYFLDNLTKPRTHYAYITLPSPPNDKFEDKKEHTDVLCAHEPTEESNATIDDDSSSSNLMDNFSEIQQPAAKKKRLSIDLEDINEENLDLCFLKSMLSDMKLMNSDQKRRFKVGTLNLSGTILNEKVAPMSMKQNSVEADHPNFFSSSNHSSSAYAQPTEQIEINSQKKEVILTTNNQAKSQRQNTESWPTSACSSVLFDVDIKEELID